MPCPLVYIAAASLHLFLCSGAWLKGSKVNSLLSQRERKGMSSYCSAPVNVLPCFPGTGLCTFVSCMHLLSLCCHLASPFRHLCWLLHVDLCCAPSLLLRWSLWSLHSECIAAALYSSEGQQDAENERGFLYLLVDAWPEFPAAVVVGRVFFNQKHSAPSIKPQKTSVGAVEFRAVLKT